MIILNLFDGLKSPNWSIKNASMLLFSKIIKNMFHYNNKNIPSLSKYLSNKHNLRIKILEILKGKFILLNHI